LPIPLLITRRLIFFREGRNWISFNATASEAERLFQTKYHYYEHHDVKARGYRIACDEYHLPEKVRRHVDFAMPTIHLEGLRPVPNALGRRAAVRPPVEGLTGLANCYELITIECLRALYHFGAGNTSAPGNQLGIPSWGSYLRPDDLSAYFQNYTTQPIPNTTFPEFVSIDGGLRWNSSLQIGREAALDVQTAYAIIYPQAVRYYQVGDIDVGITGSFNTFLDALDGSYCAYLGGDAAYLDPVYPSPSPGGYSGPLQCGGAPPTNVLSFSYLQIEAALPASFQTRQCNEYLKLGLQGVSVLFVSGDSGVANRYSSQSNNTCLTPLATGDFLSPSGPRFSPSFPSNCPWVTTVGGTFLKSHNLSDGEVAVALPYAPNPLLDYYSGGGFSNIFPRPDYQSAAVTSYLTNHPPPYPSPDIYNSLGRAYPDLSAMALNLSVVINSRVQVAGGTSASTPVVASIITLLNEARIAVGKGPIGFLNPTLYAHPEAFRDVTEGANPGCGTAGFTAEKGWDPVTGLGTPDYGRLEEVFLGLP